MLRHNLTILFVMDHYFFLHLASSLYRQPVRAEGRGGGGGGGGLVLIGGCGTPVGGGGSEQKS